MGELPVVPPVGGAGQEAARVTRPDAKILVFLGTRVVLRESEGGLRLPTLGEAIRDFGEDRLTAGRVDVRVTLGDEPVDTFGLDGDALPEGYREKGLRAAYHSLERSEFRAAGAARHLVEWRRATRFCSACASELTAGNGQHVLVCSACDRLHFPPVSPAVIVLVQRGSQALLGRSPRFKEGVYSTLAGFVEPGESLEECVHREIFEEVGVRVHRLRYFGSQPHPFPHSLMVGFIADWLEGDIVIDEDEIEDARWFDYDDLPVLPHPMSIARALIEDFARRVESERRTGASPAD